MPPLSDVVVLKFGSSVLPGPDGFRGAAAEVAREVERGRRVVAVVSAQDGVTDALLKAASAVGGRNGEGVGGATDTVPAALLARLLATGEAASVALLALALAAAGVAAHAVEAPALGLRTRGPALDAEPEAVDAERLRSLLATRPAVVVPGFVGVDSCGEPTLLGRGGSDLTALFLAHALDAVECRLVKDVDGLYPADPRAGPVGPPYETASWEVVEAVGGELVQPKAVGFARERGLAFRIAGLGGAGTWVGAGPSAPSARGGGAATEAVHLAMDVSVPRRRSNEIVHGKRSMAADTALRVACHFQDDRGPPACRASAETSPGRGPSGVA